MQDIKVGDICECSKHSRYSHVLILSMEGDTHYRYLTNLGTKESCHIRSLMGLDLKPIISNMQSFEEARSLYPEYFV